MTAAVLFCAVFVVVVVALQVGGDQGAVTSETVFVEKQPKEFPVVNAHWHLGDAREHFDLAVRVMDETGVAVSVDLSGGSGEKLKDKLEFAAAHPGRFLVFCGFPFGEDDRDDPDIGRKLADHLEESVEAGAVGCGEIGWTSLKGYHEWDDPRLVPFWEKAIELAIPLNWHAAQPARYWRPETPYNRLEGESHHGKAAKCQHELLRERDRILEKYEDLVVIAPHASYAADQIPYLIYLMEKHPNFHIDISAVLEECGKRPHEFYDFCVDYQDRILFGTDSSVRAKTIESAGSLERVIENWKAFMMAHYLFLGTDQRWIPCPFAGNQGRWVGYRVNGFPRYYHEGVNLPETVLEKIYYKNAERLFGINVAQAKG